jgi:hypothetical protein
MTHMPLRELFAMYKVGGRIGAAVHSEYGHRMRNAVSDTSLVNIEAHILGTGQRRLAWGGRDPELIYHDNGDTEVIIAPSFPRASTSATSTISTVPCYFMKQNSVDMI